MRKIRTAVVGAGAFGKNHLRVLEQSARAELVAVVDSDRARAQEAGRRFRCAALEDFRALQGQAEAAVVAVPTEAHAEVGCALLEAGLDVLVEKPMAADLASAQRLIHAAQEGSRILQVGHLERFNPAVLALKKHTRRPLFFEIHRLSLFTARSLDIDVVLDLMIHDLDILLDLVGQLPQEIRAAGISILSSKVDIANVRLAFPGGCVANLTASRVSTERVRKLRMFQPGQYVSLDYSRQDAAVFQVAENRQIASRLLAVERAEPLRLELESFLDAVETRSQPLVTGAEACRALELALAILGKIEEHSRLIARSLTAQES